MSVRIYIAILAGVLVAAATAAPAQQMLVRTAARAATREETQQTLHLVDMAAGTVLPWKESLPGMQSVTPVIIDRDDMWAFTTTRALWPQPEGWPSELSAIRAIPIHPEMMTSIADGANILLGRHQELGCIQAQSRQAASVIVLEGEAPSGSGLVTLRTFDRLSGFEKTPAASWRMPGEPVQAVALDDGRAAILCRGALGVFLVVLDMRTRDVVADVTLSPLGDPAQGPASSLELALSAHGNRLLVLTSGFSLESPAGEQRTWLHQLDAATLEPLEDVQEFTGVPQVPGESLWPLATGACWLATAGFGEGFAYLYRVPLTPSAPRAVEQPFTNVSTPLRVAPAPRGNGVAIGIRNRLEIWPEGEPAGTPMQFDNDLTTVTWSNDGLLAGEGNRLHLIDPEHKAAVRTVEFQTGAVAEALPLRAAVTRWDAAHPISGRLPEVLVFRGEAVGRERRVLRMYGEQEQEVAWKIEFDAATMPWLHAYPRSGGPGEASFSVLGIDGSVIANQPPGDVLTGVVYVELRETGGIAEGAVTRHAITVQVSPRPAGPRSILWLLGSEESRGNTPGDDRAGALQAAAGMLAGPPHWFSHRFAAPPFTEPLTGFAVAVVTARAASEGSVTRQALLSYVAAGGGVLFLGEHLGNSKERNLIDWLEPIGVRLDTARKVTGVFEVSGAPLLCRNWNSVAIESGCRIQVDPPGTTLVRDPDSGGAIFAVVPYGLGRMAFLASAGPLDSRALSDTAHRRFVGDLVRWLDDAGRDVSDVDGDGLPDIIEDANQNGALDPGETDRFDPDSDGDGIPDGIEDRNRNGRTDEGETSALNADSDGDGIPDGADLAPLPVAGTPVVDTVRPAEWPAEGGIWVQVSGRNFAPGMRVRFGERSAERLRVLGPQGLEAELPAAEAQAGGVVDVAVEGAEQTGTLPGGFRYLPRSTATLELIETPDGDGITQLSIVASSERPAQVDRLTFRVVTEPPRAVEWLDIAPGEDALRSGRQVVSRPDPEGGIWIDISPARTGYALGQLVTVRCRAIEDAAQAPPEFRITRARAFAPNGALLAVEGMGE